MSVNEIQIGGSHYKSVLQHWDFVVNHNVSYLIANATKYLTRWRKKNGVQDLEKAGHYVSKALELYRAGTDVMTSTAGVADCYSFCKTNGLDTRETLAFTLLSAEGANDNELVHALEIIDELKAAA